MERFIWLIIVSSWSYCFYKIGYENRKVANVLEELCTRRAEHELQLAELIKEAHTKLEQPDEKGE